MQELEKYFAVAAGLGILTELTARLFRMWLYRRMLTPVLNVALMFGLVQGVFIAGIVGYGQPLSGITPVLFMTGAVVGIFYEGLNEYNLHAWSWPDTRLFGISASRDKAALIGVSWGLVPVLTNILVRMI